MKNSDFQWNIRQKYKYFWFKPVIPASSKVFLFMFLSSSHTMTSCYTTVKISAKQVHFNSAVLIWSKMFKKKCFLVNLDPMGCKFCSYNHRKRKLTHFYIFHILNILWYLKWYKILILKNASVYALFWILCSWSHIPNLGAWISL